MLVGDDQGSLCSAVSIDVPNRDSNVQRPDQVTNSKQEVAKTNHVNQLSEKLNELEQQRLREREDELARRRETARMEADAINRITIKMHEREKQHANETKARFNRINNMYAPDALRLASLGG